MDEMIHGQAVDEHGARIGIPDDGDLRVYACGPYGRRVAGPFGLNQLMAWAASWVLTIINGGGYWV